MVGTSPGVLEGRTKGTRMGPQVLERKVVGPTRAVEAETTTLGGPGEAHVVRLAKMTDGARGTLVDLTVAARIDGRVVTLA